MATGGSKGRTPPDGVESTIAKPQKKKSDNVYESFLEFLHSPIWILPVMSFIEQRSLVFDVDQGDERLFHQIHAEFKAMIDMLIASFCDDAGIKADKVAEALKSHTKKTQVEQNMLEPVIAAQDYNVFVHLMMRKNIELQLQALEMIEMLCGLIPAVLLPGGPEDMGRGGDDQERLILIEVMRKSKEDYDREQTMRDTADRELMDRAMRESLTERERLQLQRRQEQDLINKALQLNIEEKNEKIPAKNEKNENRKELKEEEQVQVEKTIANEKSSKSSEISSKRRQSLKANKEKEKKDPTELGPLKQRKPSADELAGLPRPKSNKSKTETDESDLAAMTSGLNSKQIQALLHDRNAGISPEELKRRQEYLREQRDKMLSMRQEARQKAFLEAEKKNSSDRPKTSRAARSAMSGAKINQKLGDDVLAARKALAEKLKAEIGGL